MSLRLKQEFKDSRRLQMHVDHNPDEHVLVYPYFRHTLLALIREYPDFPVVERKKILRFTAEAIKEFHDQDWIHIGTMQRTLDIALQGF
jgi:hypothetical protein